MATTASGFRYPVSTNVFQPHIDIKNLADDIQAKLAPTTRVWKFVRSDPGGFGTWTGTSYTALVSGTVTGAQPGKYLIAAALVLRGGTTAGGTARLYAGGVQQMETFCDVQPTPEVRPIMFFQDDYTLPSGTSFTIEAGAAITAGTTTVYVPGTYVMATYLGP